MTADTVLRPSQLPVFALPEADDRSGHRHRQTIGVLGAVLPPVIVILDRARPTAGLPPADLTSISAYYYTAAVIAFAGILSALAIFLFTYRGYNNKFGLHDQIASAIAGLAAVFVICFPTDPPGALADPSWWSEAVGRTHYVAAVILFLCFAYFSLVLFPKSDRDWKARSIGKRARTVIYYLCGIGILACLAWAWRAGSMERPIFWQETIALELFAASWLVKGKLDLTAWRVTARGAYIARHPRESFRTLQKTPRDKAA